MKRLYNNYSMHIKRWIEEGPNEDEKNLQGFWNELVFAILRHYYWLGNKDDEIHRETWDWVDSHDILSLPQTCIVTERDMERIIRDGIKYCHDHPELVRRNTTAQTFPITLDHVKEIIRLMDINEWNTFNLRWFCFIFRLYRFVATNGERYRKNGWYYVSSRDMWTFGFYGSNTETKKRYRKFLEKTKNNQIIYFTGRKQSHLKVKLRIIPRISDNKDITTPTEALICYYSSDKIETIFRKVKKEYYDCLIRVV